MSKTKLAQSGNSSLNVLLGAQFSLFNCPLDALFQKKGEKMTILLMPREMEDNPGVSIAELIEGITSLVSKAAGEAPGLEGELKTKLSNACGADALQKITIKLTMLYLYIVKDGTNPTNVEYAFRLDVTAGGVIPEGLKSLITVDALSLAIWNTPRKEIIDIMGLCEPGKFLTA